MRRWAKCLGLTAGVVSVFVTLALAWLAVKTYQGQNDLTREMSALKREGYPTSPRELQAPLPPDSRNAAVEYTALGKLLRARPLIDYNLPGDAREAALKLALSRRSDVLDLAVRAASKPSCVVWRNWSSPEVIVLPEYFYMRIAASSIAARSELLAQRGDLRGAIRLQRLGFRIASHSNTDPVLVSKFPDTQCRALTLDGLAAIMRIAGPDAKTAREVAATVRENQAAMNLKSSIGGDIALTIRSWRAWGRSPQFVRKLYADNYVKHFDHQSPCSRAVDAITMPVGRPLMDGALARILRESRRAAALWTLPESIRLREINSFCTEMEREIAANSWNPRLVVTAFGVDELRLAASREFSIKAKERVVLAAADLLCYRANHKTFPVRLEDATVTVDPFTQQPLRYHREGRGFVVYSVGETGKFDGANEKKNKWNAVFRYPAA